MQAFIWDLLGIERLCFDKVKGNWDRLQPPVILSDHSLIFTKSQMESCNLYFNVRFRKMFCDPYCQSYECFSECHFSLGIIKKSIKLAIFWNRMPTERNYRWFVSLLCTRNWPPEVQTRDPELQKCLLVNPNICVNRWMASPNFEPSDFLWYLIFS